MSAIVTALVFVRQHLCDTRVSVWYLRSAWPKFHSSIRNWHHNLWWKLKNSVRSSLALIKSKWSRPWNLYRLVLHTMKKFEFLRPFSFLLKKLCLLWISFILNWKQKVCWQSPAMFYLSTLCSKFKCWQHLPDPDKLPPRSF